MKRTLMLVVGAATWLSATTAFAQDAGFGQRGQISIQGDFQLTLQNSSYTVPKGTAPDSTTHLVLGPALDYFVIDNLSVGGQLAYESVSGGLSGFTIGPRVGYDVLLGSRFSVWPRGGFSFFTGSADSKSVSRFSFVAFVPFLIHPAPHFFVGLGPSLSVDLSSSYDGDDAPKTTTFGVTSVVGGWF